jgi:hypothetical protein
MMDFENGDMNAIETCDVEGESGKKDEAMGDRATVWVSIPVSVVQEDIERNGGSPSSLLLDG